MSYLIWLVKDYRKSLSGFTAMVSEDDCDLDDYQWTMRKRGHVYYAQRYKTIDGKKRTLHLHRVIMARLLGRELRQTEEVDHINGYGLDCRRENLRLATRSENARNSRINSRNKSGVTGVAWNKASGKWHAYIVQKNLGLFDDFDEAVATRREAELKYYGEFPPLLSRQETA